MNILKKEPALAAAVVALLTAIVGVFIKNTALAGSLVGVAAVFLGVRQVVTPVTTAAEKITEAATTAATEVVKDLTTATVGVTGQVTDAAQGIVHTVVENTVGKVLGGLLGGDPP